MRRTFFWATLLGLAPAALALGADDTPNDSRLGAKPPEGAVVLLNGKNTEGWVTVGEKKPAEWPVVDGVMTVGVNSIQTEKTFGDVQLHIEFNVPYMPQARGQARGNSGVYLAGCHEVQVLDSYGLPPKNNECAGIYQQATPRVNASKPPLRWQSYDITFHKAQVEGGKTVKKARITVIHNGVNVIDNVEINPTPGGIGTQAGDDGPLMLQDHGNKVQFRNIWAKPL